MGYRLLSADLHDFVVPTNDLGDNNRQQTKVVSPQGEIAYSEQRIREYLSIVEGQYSIQDALTISGKGDSALLEIQFNLSSTAIHYQDKWGVERFTPARSGNIMFLSADENEAKLHLQKDSSYHTFDIHLPVSFLEHYAGVSKLLDNFLTKVQQGVSTGLMPRNVQINAAILNVIQEMKTCSFEGLTRRMYLESKAYELIALLYEYGEESTFQASTLHVSDRDKIQQASSIIAENLERPLTILELAQRVGINQTKLKTGFRDLYGNTVFGYLQEIRMHQAKRYLLDTQLSIQEISMRVGYQHMSNFSIAFKKTFGYSPIKLRERG